MSKSLLRRPLSRRGVHGRSWKWGILGMLLPYLIFGNTLRQAIIQSSSSSLEVEELDQQHEDPTEQHIGASPVSKDAEHIVFAAPNAETEDVLQNDNWLRVEDPSVPAARESLDGNDAAPVVADDETSSPRVVASEAEQRAPGAGRGAGEVLLQRWLGARSRQEAQDSDEEDVVEEAIAGKLHRKHAASIPKPRVPRIDPQPHEYAGLDEDALMDALLMKPEAGDRSKREQTRNSAAAPPGSEPVLRKGAVQHPRGEPDVQSADEGEGPPLDGAPPASRPAALTQGEESGQQPAHLVELGRLDESGRRAAVQSSPRASTELAAEEEGEEDGVEDVWDPVLKEVLAMRVSSIRPGAGNDTAIADEDSPESTFGLPPMPEPVLETLRTDCSDRSSEMNSAEAEGRDLMDVLIDTLHRKTACLRKQLGVLSKYKIEYEVAQKKLKNARRASREAELDLRWFDDFVAGRVPPPSAPVEEQAASVDDMQGRLERLLAIARMHPNGLIPQETLNQLQLVQWKRESRTRAAADDAALMEALQSQLEPRGLAMHRDNRWCRRWRDGLPHTKVWSGSVNLPDDEYSVDDDPQYDEELQAGSSKIQDAGGVQHPVSGSHRHLQAFEGREVGSEHASDGKDMEDIVERLSQEPARHREQGASALDQLAQQQLEEQDTDSAMDDVLADLVRGGDDTQQANEDSLKIPVGSLMYQRGVVMDVVMGEKQNEAASHPDLKPGMIYEDTLPTDPIKVLQKTDTAQRGSGNSTSLQMAALGPVEEKQQHKVVRPEGEWEEVVEPNAQADLSNIAHQIKERASHSSDELRTKPEDTEEYFFVKCDIGELTEEEQEIQAKLVQDRNRRVSARAKKMRHLKLIQRKERQHMLKMVESMEKTLDAELHKEETEKLQIMERQKALREARKREKDDARRKEWEKNIERATRQAQKKGIIITKDVD